MKKIIGVIVLVIIVILIIVLSGGSKGDTGPIKIGFIGPLTGDAATFGEPISNAIKLAEKEINDAGGVNGRPLQVVFEDGKCDGATAVSAAQKLINIDKVRFIIDGVCSGEVLATAPVVEAAKVLILSPGATSPKISGIGKYVFRNAPSDAGRGTAIADYAAKYYKKPAIISEQTDYADGLTKTFTSELKVKNMEIVANELYKSETTDFRSVLLKIKQAQPDILFLNAQTPANLVRLSQQARAIGITAQFIASEFNDPTVVEAGSSTEGLIISVAPNLSNEGKGKLLLDAYKAMFGKDAAYPYYVGAAYDDLHLFAEGIKQFEEDSTLVKDYLNNLKGYEGTIGTYSFDQNGDIVGISFVFQKVVGKKITNISL